MSIALVRSLIADPFQYERTAATGDGNTAEFLLTNSPVKADSQKVYIGGALKVETTDYTFDDDLGLVTFLTTPANGAAITITYQHSVLSAAALDDFLTLEGGNDRLAAATALDVIASSEALVQKRIKLLDLETDGPAVADALRKHAEALRKTVTDGTTGDVAFDYAEMVVDNFSARERLWKQALREDV